MTTNQTAPVTDEELDQMIWKLERDGMTPKQLSLMRELREVRRAKGEPAAWRYRYVHTPKSEEHGSHFTSNWKLCDSEDECNPSDCFERQALFTSPSAPTVSVELVDLLSMAASAIEDLLEHTDPNTSYYAGVWADVPGKLRAAIQSFGNTEGLEPVSNRDELPPNSFTNEELDFMAHGDNPQANACRELLAFRRNSPATTDVWIPVRERMPENMDTVITSNGFDIGHGWWDGDTWQEWSYHDAVPGDVTHWMPLPAAPKEVE